MECHRRYSLRANCEVESLRVDIHIFVTGRLLGHVTDYLGLRGPGLIMRSERKGREPREDVRHVNISGKVGRQAHSTRAFGKKTRKVSNRFRSVGRSSSRAHARELISHFLFQERFGRPGKRFI